MRGADQLVLAACALLAFAGALARPVVLALDDELAVACAFWGRPRRWLAWASPLVHIKSEAALAGTAAVALVVVSIAARAMSRAAAQGGGDAGPGTGPPSAGGTHGS